MSPPRLLGVGGNGGGSSSVGASGVGFRRGRDGMVATTATSSGFDVDDWSDSSNEPPRKGSSKGIETRGARAPTCQLQSLARRKGGGGDRGTSGNGVAPSRSVKQPRRLPSPSPPPATARAKSRSPSPSRGVGPRSGCYSRGSLVTQGAPTATAAATATSTSARTATGRRPGETIASRPPNGRSSKSKEAYEWRVGARPERSSSPVAVGRQQGRGAGGGAGALRAPVGGRGGARVRVGFFKELATRRLLEAEGSDRKSKGLVEETASPSVFDLDDDSD